MNCYVTHLVFHLHVVYYSCIVGTACLVCAAESMQLSGVRLSVRLSVPSGRRTPLQSMTALLISAICCSAPLPSVL